jgi:hypothetical protein
MTQEDYRHPIAPAPELVQQWRGEAVSNPKETFSQSLATRAAQWGADQELKACCQWLHCHAVTEFAPGDLRAARRPKPPSLKEQALDAHNRMMAGTETQDDWTIVRRALEQLPDNK